MQRLLLLRLEATGCAAEAGVNGIPVARTPPGGGVMCLPIHEFTMAGGNGLDLVIEPAPLVPGADPVPSQSRIVDQGVSASLRLLLPRLGSPASALEARTVGLIEWAPQSVEVIDTPLRLELAVDLPVSFPRWRWLDAPEVGNVVSLATEIALFLKGLAVSLARGDPENLISAARLRFEELAVAYQRSPVEDLARFRAHIQTTHAKFPLRPILPTPQTLVLRSCARGRLIECLGTDGLPALRCPGFAGSQSMWPIRLARVDERFYVLR